MKEQNKLVTPKEVTNEIRASLILKKASVFDLFAGDLKKVVYENYGYA